MYYIFQQIQDPCSPASKLSLTARPADHHDLDQTEDQQEQTDRKHIEDDPNATQQEDYIPVENQELNNNNNEVTAEVETEVLNEKDENVEIQGD